MKEILKLIVIAVVVAGCGKTPNSDRGPNDKNEIGNDRKGSEVEKDDPPGERDENNGDNRTLALSEVSLEDLEGQWHQPCYGAGLYFSPFSVQGLSGAKRVTRTVVFEKESFQIQVFGFSSENCSSDSLVVKVSLSGQFKLSGPNLWYIGGSKIDSTIQTAEVTPLTEEASKGLNDFRWGGTNRYNGFCKFENWSNSIKMDVFSRDCDYLDKSDYLPFSIVKIQNTELYFGFDDREHDGSVQEKRPTEWSHYALSKSE